MKILKKVLSALLAVTMLLSITAGLNLTVFASEDDFAYSELDDGTVEISYDGSASNVTIPTTIGGYKVTAISTYGFGEKTNLKSVTIPNGITSIGANAFKDCTNLNSITIPNSITSIGYGAFENTAYYNNKSNWSNGVLYIGNYLIATDGEIVSGSYSIKSGTTVIAEEGFNACNNITSVTIPNSVKYIGSDSFSNLNISSITIPDSVINIGSGSFIACSDLTSITVASGNKNYKSVNGVLYNKNQTELIRYPEGKTTTSFSIPTGVTRIADSAFEFCNLRNITIPSSVTSIGRYAFLLSDYYDNENNWTNGVLYIGNCLVAVDSDVVSGSYSIKSGTTVIADGAFDWCESLTNVIIPAGIKQIGDSVFRYCQNLKSVTIPNGVTSIGEEAFEGSGLTSVTIPNSVTGIGNWAFADCEKLSNVTIGNNVKSIGRYGFAFCDSLKSITVPKSVTQIGWSAFYNGNDFVLNCYYGSAAHKYAEKEYITYKFVSNDGMEKINNFETKTVTLSNTDKYYLVFTPTESGIYVCCLIAADHEAWCHVYDSNMNEVGGYEGGEDAWSTVSYPLEKGKTYYLVCETYEPSITGNVGVGLRHDHKFSNGKCTICGTSEFQYTVLSGGTAEITHYLGSATNLTIPSTLDGYKVTSVGEEAFAWCENLTNVTIPSGVTSIKDYAFGACVNLKSVTIPNSVKSIGDTAFHGCGLTSLTIPNSVTSIGDFTFAWCENLKSVTIPNSVKSIGDCAFAGCALTSVTIPISVTSLGDDVFSNCSKLTSITVDSNNKNYTSLNGVLYNKGKTAILAYPKAKADSSYTVPNTVTSIVYGPFRDCNNLKSVSLPTSVKSIEEESFGSCKNLSSITIQNKTCEIKANEYYSTIPKATTINGYKGSTAETYAKKFGNKFVALSETTKLSAPTLKVTVNTSGTFTLSWNKITDAEKYEIYSKQADGSYTLLKTVTGTSYTTVVGEYGKQYSYKMKAVKGSTKSDYSKVVNATNNKKLQTPTLKVAVNSNGTFKMTWNKVTGATSYQIYYKQADGSYKLLKTVTGTSYTSGFAQYGKQYSYKMKAVTSKNSSATSNYSSVVNATNNKKLQTPTLKVSVNSNGTFKMTWNKVTGATSYQIYYKQADGSYKLLKTVTGTSYTSGFAQYGKQYSYKVRAVTSKNSSATSAYSSVVNATNNKKLQTPTLKVAVNSNGTFKMTWNKVTGATSYQIYYKQADGSYKLLKTVTGTSYTSGFAQYGKQYSYKVRAVTSKNSSATSNFSSVVNAKNTKKLGTPTLKATVNKNGSFKLSWGKVTGATSYQIYWKQANGSYKLLKTVTGTSYTTVVAAKGKTYNYKVRAVTKNNSSATSNYSNVVSAKRK